MASIGAYWSGALTGFTASSMTTFSGQVPTGCGSASSSVGPFYCPVDKIIYIDTDYTATLLAQLGAKGGDAAEGYIVAHEYGHHIQNLTGVMAKAQSSTQTGAGSASVRLELQADCYAGVWFRHSTDDPNGVIKSVTQDDLNRIVDAAIAVGDDAIQKAQTGSVNRESWTHGSSAQRKNWVSIGFKTGDPTSATLSARRTSADQCGVTSTPSSVMTDCSPLTVKYMRGSGVLSFVSTSRLQPGASDCGLALAESLSNDDAMIDGLTSAGSKGDKLVASRRVVVRTGSRG